MRMRCVASVHGDRGGVVAHLGHEVGEAEECVSLYRRLRGRLLLLVESRGGGAVARRLAARLACPVELKTEDIVDGREYLEGCVCGVCAVCVRCV